jgi:hypothetical protein
MTNIELGSVWKFSIPQPDKGELQRHVCKVEVMKQELVKSVSGRSGDILYTCRRIDNGTTVLAWGTDLS